VYEKTSSRHFTPQLNRIYLNNLLTYRIIRLFCAIFSGILLIIIFPNAHLWFLAWVAFVPLILAVSNRPPWERCLLGFITGAIALFGIHYWLLDIAGFGWIQALVLLLFYGSFFIVWSLSLSSLDKKPCSLYFAPFFWVVLEYIRANVGFMANPFAQLAQSQSSNLLLLQLASITGEYGISFLIILFNVALAQWILDSSYGRHLAGVLLLILLVHLWGWHVIEKNPDHIKTVKIGVVQPCLSRAEIQQINGDELRLLRLQKLTLSITNKDPDIIVWPESAMKNLHTNLKQKEILKSFAQYLNKPIITGVSAYNYKDRNRKGQPVQNFNAAYYVTPDRDYSPPYFKNILLPFSEYLPLETVVDWPDWLLLDDFGISAGTKLSRFPIKDDVYFSVIICWENLFAEFVRQVVRQDVDMVVHLVNDNWFGKTAASRQHNLASIFRAVENGVPVIVASNTGPSSIIDRYGRVVSSLPTLFKQGAMFAKVQVSRQITVYSKYGDWFVIFATSIIFLFCLWKRGSLIKKRKSK